MTERNIATMVVTDVASWDREPARLILVSLLIGDSTVQGRSHIEDEISQMARAGLLSHECIGNDKWRLQGSLFGRLAAVRLAYSIELLQAIAAFNRVTRAGHPWTGVHPVVMLRELDLRDGGDGRVDDPSQWLMHRSAGAVQRLPRRDGLDGPEVEHA
jgi:hypothetical protein